MKSLIYKICIATLLLSVAIPGMAQKIYNGQIAILSHELRQQGDSLILDMVFDFSGIKIDANRHLTLTPVLVAPDNETGLPEIVVNGRSWQKVYEREMALDGASSTTPYPTYAVIKAGSKKDKTLRYRMTLPFEEWMKDARLDMKEDLCNCGGQPQELATELLVNHVSPEHTEYDIMTAYIKPEVEEVKLRSEQREAFLDFPVAQTVIYPDFGSNPKELNKIQSMILEIRNDKNVKVSHVCIKGYASPEGSFELNERLSEGRAQALKKYLASNLDIPLSMYQVEHGGEDWNGLVKLLDNVVIEYRNEIISIIQNIYNVDTRKRMLRELGGGQPYQYMLKNLYPELRRVVSRVDYSVRGFSIEEAKEIIKTRPQQLSLEEMYLVANSYDKNDDAFAKVFETAVQLFPDDKVANLNAAASALAVHDPERAQRYLDRADKNTPEYKNNLGVLYLMRGENDRARQLFAEASATGLAEAAHNLKELQEK